MKKTTNMLRAFAVILMITLAALVSGCPMDSPASRTFMVIYDGNGTTSGTVPVDSTSYLSGASVTVRGNTGGLAKTNFSFAGWNTAADGSGTTYAEGSTFPMAAADITLYAVWSQNVHTLSFDANGGEGTMASGTVAEGATVTLPSCDFTLERYSFAGWNTAADGSGAIYAAGSAFTMATADITLYAVWSQNVHTLSFDANGGEGTMASRIVAEGAPEILPSCDFTLVGYSFAGWNTAADGSGTTYAASSTFTMAASDITLYAVWSQNMHTLSFDANTGDGTMASRTMAEGATVTLPSCDFTLVGYSFAGWNTAADGSGETYAAGSTFTMASSDITLYAVWLQIMHTLSFDANGGDGTMASRSVAEGATITLPSCEFTLEGNGFAGWNTAADGSGTSYRTGSSIQIVTSDITLYAMWSAEVILIMTPDDVNRGYTSAEIFTINLSFNKNVSGLDSDDIAVTNGRLSEITGSDKTYTAEIIVTAEANVEKDVTVTVRNGAASDVYGITSKETSCTVIYDSSKPQTINPVITKAGGGKITINWSTPSDDPSFDHVLVSYNSSAQVKLENGETTYTFNGLATGGTYLPLLVAVDAAGNESANGEGVNICLYDDVSRNVYYPATPDQLADMSDDRSGFYLISADIDLSIDDDTKEWTPVGPDAWSKFTGIIDGQGHTISNLKITSNNYDQGLLGYADNITITNINFVNVSMKCPSSYYLGTIVGEMVSGTINACTVSGSFDSYGEQAMGGLIGLAKGSIVVSDCHVSSTTFSGYGNKIGGLIGYLNIGDSETISDISNSSAEVTIKCTGSGSCLGGIIGDAHSMYTSSSLNVSSCYSNITVTPTAGRITCVGGLLGALTADSTITDCYSIGTLGNSSSESVGGLIGASGANLTLSNSYSSCGITASVESGTMLGRYGSDLPIIENCYYNSDASSLTAVYCDPDGAAVSTVTGVTPRTEEEMTHQSNFSGFDFTSGQPVWSIDENNGFPYLTNNHP